ncbi:MAG TPA: FxSxx-COOH system tetratricopeptide repeat protein [Iamia sp.]
MRPGEDRWDVFLAHASPDKPRARILYQALTTLGLEVFLDEESLQPGDIWPREIPRALRASDVVVVLVSAATETAHYEGEEIVIAISKARDGSQRVVPIHLEPGIDDPYGTAMFNRMTWHDETEVDAIAGRIAGVAPGRSAPRGAGTFSPQIPEVPEHFTGRDGLLEELAARMGSGATTTLVQRIQGMGGVGKTTVAAALCRAHRPLLDVVWWVRAEEPTTLVADLASLASDLGIVAPSDEDAARKVQRWLETTDGRWLVVFDNVGSADALALRPRDGNGTVIVTTRVRDLHVPGSELAVDLFPNATAARYLRDRVRDRNPRAAEEDVTAVVERLGGLPLALEQAAAWVAKLPNRRFAHWVSLFDDLTGDPFPAKNLPPDQATAEKTWRVSIDAANADAPFAERLLAGLAFFAPEQIPIPWLRDASSDLDGASPTDVGDAIEALHTYALVTVSEDDTLDVHRVIGAASRRAGDPDALGFACRCIARQDPDDNDPVVAGAALVTLATHAMAVAASIGEPVPAGASNLGYLLNGISQALLSLGQVNAAAISGAAAERLSGLVDDERLAIAARNSRASALEEAGAVTEAIEIFDHNLTASATVFGRDHEMHLTCRGNLAGAYRAAGNLTRATPLFEQTLTDCERILGPDHPNTLLSRNNLAGAYQDGGNLTRATPLFEQTLADRERILGPDHPNTLTSLNNLALTHQDAGNLTRALALLEEALDGCDRALGSDNPTTQVVQNNIERVRREMTEPGD